MLDNLRDDIEMDFGDEELPDFLDDFDGNEKKPASNPFAFLDPITKKMNATQRFVIAALLFMMVCLIGSMLLLVTGTFNLGIF